MSKYRSLSMQHPKTVKIKEHDPVREKYVVSLLRRNPELTVRQISKITGVSVKAVNKIRKKI